MKKIVYFLVAVAVMACTDDDTFTSAPSSPILTEEITLKRINDFHDINIPGDADWEVTDHPFWAVPMAFEGTAGDELNIFVETNCDDEDRIDTLRVSLNNGGTISIPIRQHGMASADENSGITYLDSKALNRYLDIGFGIDVVDRTAEIGAKYNIKSSPFNLGIVQQVLDNKGWNDAIIEDSLYYSRYETVTGNSTNAISNQLGINAGIEVGIKAFKFSVEAGYSSSSNQDTKYSYAMLEMQHIVCSRYFRGGLMRYLAENESEMLKSITLKRTEPNAKKSLFQKRFREYVSMLMTASAESDLAKETMKDLVTNYGTHVICHGTIGGELCVTMQKQEDNSSSGTSIHAALGVSAKVLDAEGKFTMEGADSAATANTTISLRSYGGNNSFTIAPGTTFESFMEDLKGGNHKRDSTVNIDQWAEGFRRQDNTKELSLALIDIQTIPIWDLMPNERVRDMLHHYIVKDYQEDIARKYNSTFKPDLYGITGYDVKTSVPGKGSIYIPEIGIQIDFERKIIQELDSNELSTVVYSGTKGNVNRDRGFFVGSKTRKPCKFHREKNKKFTIEEFDMLSKAPISELYVDVTGDITIAPKGISDMYVTETIDWKHDLSILTEPIKIEEDVTVTGTTDHSIAIADGVTLTLSDVNIRNNIVCQGNATIILKDGTKNYIGNKYTNIEQAGIQVGPKGTTLVLNGNGLLDVRGWEHSAGIGAKYQTECGDIIINGGTIKAMGSAGIGSGENARCGRITINGGNVDAKGDTYAPGIGAGEDGNCDAIIINGGDVRGGGGNYGAGIGSGLSGKCGDIQINGGTITATGRDAVGIGAGKRGNCGDIEINGGTITATGDGDVGIGSGDRGSVGLIQFSKCTVMAKGGGVNCPAIGCSTGKYSGINIKGDIVNIEAISGGYTAPPIGSQSNGIVNVVVDGIAEWRGLRNTPNLSINFIDSHHVIISQRNK